VHTTQRTIRVSRSVPIERVRALVLVCDTLARLE